MDENTIVSSATLKSVLLVSLFHVTVTSFCNYSQLCHCKNGIVIMTYSLSFWLQMSEPIRHMDIDNYMTIHNKGTSYFDSTAYLVCFVHLFTRKDELLFIVIIA